MIKTKIMIKTMIRIKVISRSLSKVRDRETPRFPHSRRSRC